MSREEDKVSEVDFSSLGADESFSEESEQAEDLHNQDSEEMESEILEDSQESSELSFLSVPNLESELESCLIDKKEKAKGISLEDFQLI